jgi:hypothetical protein
MSETFNRKHFMLAFPNMFEKIADCKGVVETTLSHVAAAVGPRFVFFMIHHVIKTNNRFVG